MEATYLHILNESDKDRSAAMFETGKGHLTRWGLKSRSCMITIVIFQLYVLLSRQLSSRYSPVSADARLMPTPPARVDKRKIKYGESGALKASMSFCLFACGVSPS